MAHMNQTTVDTGMEKAKESARDEVTNDSALHELRAALAKLNEQKSGERTAKDRYVAIAITDLEKLIAFVSMYC